MKKEKYIQKNIIKKRKIKISAFKLKFLYHTYDINKNDI